MNDKQHGAILMAYMARMNTNQIERIKQAVLHAEHQSLNGGNSAQLSAHNELDAVCHKVASEISDRDKETIAVIAHREIARKAWSPQGRS